LATDATPGLQIQLDDAWLPVPPKPGCFIINSGDQIAQLTNRTYRSALHRVVTGATTQPRYSTAFFTYFGMHATVGPLAQFVSAQRPAAYEPQTSLEYFHYKLHESMGVGVVSNSTAVSAAS
jgi:isopenicillin N synthase-like dioxygenase